MTIDTSTMTWIAAALTVIREDDFDTLGVLYDELDDPLMIVSALLGIVVEVMDETATQEMALRAQS